MFNTQEINDKLQEFLNQNNATIYPALYVTEGGIVPIIKIKENESKGGETNTIQDRGEEVIKDGEGEIRPDKSDSPKKTK